MNKLKNWLLPHRYSLEHPYGDFSGSEPTEWQKDFFTPESYLAAKTYLSKYQLYYEDYVRNWQPLVSRIFNPEAVQVSTGLSHRTGYEGIAVLHGGRSFTRRAFSALQRCMRAVGDTHFAVIEDVRGRLDRQRGPFFRMVYPVDVSYEAFWRDDLGLISWDMACNTGEKYTVLGNSGTWGMYTISEISYVYSGEFQYYPVAFIGFLPEHTALFTQEFGRMVSNNERKALRDILPASLSDHYMKWLPEVEEVDPMLTSKVWYA